VEAFTRIPETDWVISMACVSDETSFAA